MAYHGIIWGLLSNDVGKAIRHSWALWLSLPCFHPPWESAGLGALEPWRATLGLPCLVPHKGEKLFRKQKVVCHRENMHVIEKIFSGSFFFLILVFPLICESPLPTGFQLGSTLNWWRPTLTLTILSGDDSAAAASTSAVDLSGRQRFMSHTRETRETK